MPLSRYVPVSDQRVSIFNSVNAVGGTRLSIAAPFRGRIVEIGAIPCSISASNVSLALHIGTQLDSTVSNFTQVVTSTLGTFSSLQAVEGGVLSVIPDSMVYVEKGDCVRFTVSGVNVGMTFYADFRRAGVG